MNVIVVENEMRIFYKVGHVHSTQRNYEVFLDYV